MQISEANNDLLNVVTSQNTQKTDTSLQERKFVDLLSMAQSLLEIKTEEVSRVKGNQEALANKLSDIKVKEQLKPEKQFVQSKETGKNTGQNKSAGKKDKVETNSAETSEKVIKECQSQKKDKDNQVVQGGQTEGEVQENIVAVGEENILETAENAVLPSIVIPLFVNEEEIPSLQINQEEVLVEQVTDTSSLNNEQAIYIDASNNNNAEYLPKVENTVGENIETNITEDKRQDFELSEKGNLLHSDSNKINNANVEIVEKEVVLEQEEKISSMLPEGKKIEIKVNVENDQISEKAKPEIIKMELPEKEDESVLLSQESNIKDQNAVLEPMQVSENIVAMPTALPIEQENISIISQNLAKPITMEKAEGVLPSQVATVMAVEKKATNNPTEIGSFKEVYNKGLTKDVAEQIKINITQSAIKNVDKIEIQLKPESLGQLEIKLHISKDGRLQVHIIASNAETMEILQKDTEILKEAFNNAGYQTEDESFNFSYRGEEQNNNEKEKLREFIGEVLAQDVADEIAANDYISTDGVNIRV